MGDIVARVQISVIGTGYLGAVHAVALASLGFDVVGIDVDAARIEALAAGRAPFFEPGLDELLIENTGTSRLAFSTDIADAADADVHFLCLGTPQRAGSNAADLSALERATESVAKVAKPGSLIVGKSTVPVGTADALAAVIEGLAGPEVELAWNPEFLREGMAVRDTLQPDRIVVGVRSDRAAQVLAEVYRAQIDSGVPYLVTDFATSELVKVAANAFLATKISFINAMAEVCDVAGGDVAVLAEALGYDDRIGNKFLRAGIGFGGGCLPKDIRGFMARAGEIGADEALAFLREVDEVNLRRRTQMVALAEEYLGGSVRGRRIAILGAAFKPDSDDVRDSPALAIAAELQIRGAEVKVHDPQALNNARQRFPTLGYAQSVDAALEGAELVLHLTEWPEYAALDPAEALTRVDRPVLLDGRNNLDPARWREAGWTYRAMGRPNA